MPDGGSLGKATFALEADTGTFKRGLDQAQGMAQSSTAKIGQQFKSVGAGMTAAGRGLTMGLTLPIAGVGFAAAKSFGDFDAAMTQSLAIMGDVSAEMRTEMANAAREVALSTTFSAEQAAEAYFYLASAGLDAERSLAAMPAVARFAQAGMFDMALATDLATDAQSALGMRSEDSAKDLQQLVRVTDVMVKANTLANATVEQFATSLTTKGGSALKAANKSIEEGVGLLAYWADQGLKGEAAGTALAGVLTMLPKLATKNAEAFAQYNVELFTGTGELKSFSEIADEFAPILDNMTTEQRATAYEQMGINRLMVDAINKMKGGSEAIATYTEKLGDARGITEEVADKQLQTFNAQMTLLKHQVQDVFITLGTALVPVLMDVVKGLKPVVGWLKTGAELFGKLPKPVKIAIFIFLALLAAIGPLLMVAGLLVSSIGSIIIFLPMITAVIGPVIAGFVGLLPVIGLVVLALGLLGFAIAAVVVNFSDIKRAVSAALQGFGDLVTGAIKLGGQLIVGVARGVAAAASALYSVVGAIVTNVIKLLNPFNWIFGSSIEDVYEYAGATAGDSMILALRRAIERGMGGVTGAMRRPLEAMRGVVRDVTSELDRLAGLPTVESAAQDLERAELALRQLEFKGKLRAGEERIAQVDEEIAKIRERQDALRDQAEEDKRRVDEADAEIKNMVDRRNELVFLARGRTDESDAIDAQIRAMVQEKKRLEGVAEGRLDEADALDDQIEAKEDEKDAIDDSLEAVRKQNDAIQDQIDAIDLLAERRDLERDVMVARARAADQTLATDAEVLAQLQDMEGVVAGVTGEIDEQADGLWTQFIPAWEDVVENLEEALEAEAAAEEGLEDLGGAAGGVGGAAEGVEAALGDLESAFEALDTEELIGEILPDPEKVIGEQVDKFKKWINSQLPIAGGAGVGAIIGFFFGGPVGALIGAAVGSLLGALWKKYHEPVMNFFKESGEKVLGFIKKWWPEVATALTFVFAAPLAPLVALATDAFGIRTALFNAGKEVLGFFRKNWKTIAVLISGPFAPLVALATDAFGIRTALLGAAQAILRGVTEAFNSIVNWVRSNWSAVIAELVMAPFVLLRIAAGDLWGVRTAMWNGIQAIIGFVTDAFTTIKTFIVDTLAALPERVLGLALSIGSTIFSGILQGLGMLAEIGGRVIGALSAILSEVPGWALSIGKAIFSGIMSGIGEIGQEIWDRFPGPLKWLIEQLAAGIAIAVDLDLPDVSDIPIIGGALGGLGLQRGILRVPGRGRRDSVVGRLTPGEAVMPRDAAQVLRDFFSGETGRGRGEGDINVTVHNPQPEAAEDTVRRRLQALAQLGVTG